MSEKTVAEIIKALKKKYKDDPEAMEEIESEEPSSNTKKKIMFILTIKKTLKKILTV